MARWTEKNGIALPVEPPDPAHAFRQRYQEDLIERQLPAYLQRLIDDGARIESVFLQFDGGLGGRYTVFYRHHEDLSTEVFC